MRGRPILGGISGFFFGLFLGISLWMWGVIPLHSDFLWILPVLGIVFGLVMAWWAPFGRKSTEPPGMGGPAPVDVKEPPLSAPDADPEPTD